MFDQRTVGQWTISQADCSLSNTMVKYQTNLMICISWSRQLLKGQRLSFEAVLTD